MPISLGTLFIELKANTAQYLDALDKAATKQKAFGKDLQAGFSKLGELFAPLGAAGEKLSTVLDAVGASARGAFKEIGESGALLGSLAAVTGGAVALGGTLFGLAEHAAEVGTTILEASEKTGIAAEQMSGIRALAKETGGNFDALTVSLARAGANLESAIIEPGGKAGKIFGQLLGGSKQLAAEGLKPVGDRILDVLQHIFALNDAGQRNLALSTLMGKGWMGNVATLKLLAEEGFGPAEADAKRFGEFFTGESARQAYEFTIGMKQLGNEMSGLGLKIGEWAIPQFNNLFAIMAGGLPLLESVGLKLLAVAAASTGYGLHEAIKLWKESKDKMQESYDLQNKFLARLSDLSNGQEAASRIGQTLAGVMENQAKGAGNAAEALRDLNAQEKENLEYLKQAVAMVQAPSVAGLATARVLSEGFASGGSARFGAMQDLPFIPGFGPQKPGMAFAPQFQFSAKQYPGGLADSFKTLTGPLQDQGKDLGAALASDITTSVDQIEDKFAEMAVKGKVNFKDLEQSMEKMFLKSGMQKLVSEIFSAGQTGVNSVSGQLAAGGSLGGLGAIGGFFSRIFGGFLAGGGDVTPGMTYVVGENNPEFFTPKVPGTVHKAMPTGGNTTIINHFHGVSDMDSFRRSNAQIMGEFHRAASRAIARNG